MPEREFSPSETETQPNIKPVTAATLSSRPPKTVELSSEQRRARKRRLSDQERGGARQPSSTEKTIQMPDELSTEIVDAPSHIFERDPYDELYQMYLVTDQNSTQNEAFDRMLDAWLDEEGDDPESVTRREAAQRMEAQLKKGDIPTLAGQRQQEQARGELLRESAVYEQMRQAVEQGADVNTVITQALENHPQSQAIEQFTTDAVAGMFDAYTEGHRDRAEQDARDTALDGRIKAARESTLYTNLQKKLLDVRDTYPDLTSVKEAFMARVDSAKHATSADGAQLEAYNQFLFDLDVGTLDVLARPTAEAQQIAKTARAAETPAPQQRVQQAPARGLFARLKGLFTKESAASSPQKRRRKQKAQPVFEDVSASEPLLTDLEEVDTPIVAEFEPEDTTGTALPEAATVESANQAPEQTLNDQVATWPQEINSIIGALVTESISAREAFGQLEESDKFLPWLNQLKGSTFTSVRKGDGSLVPEALTITNVRKNTNDVPTVYLKRPDGRRITLSLERFLKQNLAEADTSAKAA